MSVSIVSSDIIDLINLLPKNDKEAFELSLKKAKNINEYASVSMTPDFVYVQQVLLNAIEFLSEVHNTQPSLETSKDHIETVITRLDSALEKIDLMQEILV